MVKKKKKERKKKLLIMQETQVRSLSQEDPFSRGFLSGVFLPDNSMD